MFLVKFKFTAKPRNVSRIAAKPKLCYMHLFNIITPEFGFLLFVSDTKEKLSNKN